MLSKATFSRSASFALLCAYALSLVSSVEAFPFRRGAAPKFKSSLGDVSVSSAPDVHKEFQAVYTGCTGFMYAGKPCAPDNTVNAMAAKDPAGGGDTVLRVEFQSGKYASRSGAQFYSEFSGMGDEGMLEYDVFFPNSFDWVKGGKLPGLHGGNMRCTGSQQTPNGDNCFSTRLMWGPGGRVEGYLYLPLKKQEDAFCQKCAYEGGTSRKCSQITGDDFCHYDRGAANFKKGSWQTVRQYVKLNTPGQNNGVFELWLNGRRVMSADNVYYRDTKDMTIGGLLFSTFYGGDTSSYAPHSDEEIFFKDITVYG